MANFFNPTNSHVLNVLPVNAGRVIAHTSSITGDTEVVTFTSYRLSFTAVVNVQSTSSLSCIIPRVRLADLSKEISASTDIPLTKAVIGVGRDVEIENNTEVTVSPIRAIGRKIYLQGDTEVITYLVYRTSYTGVTEIPAKSAVGCYVIKRRITDVNIQNKGTDVDYRVHRLKYASIDQVLKGTTEVTSGEVLLYRDGYLKVVLCKDNPFDTPVDLSSTCNDLFYTSNSNTNGLKYYGTSVF